MNIFFFCSEYGGTQYEVSTSRKCELQVENLTKCLEVTRNTQMILNSYLDKVSLSVRTCYTMKLKFTGKLVNVVNNCKFFKLSS